MRLTAQEFRNWSNKRITLLGMSGVGKTRLSSHLPQQDWFHYSGDYRIGTRYLDEPILDNIKREVMQVPFLAELLRSDSIYISNNMSVDNLAPVSSYLGKLGNPELGGLPLDEFKHRQQQHYHAEIQAMLDVPDFIHKAHDIYNYQHFLNDAGGSLCELDNPQVFETLAKDTLILYIEATREDEERLMERAKSAPKPLYYRAEFLDEELDFYLHEQNLKYVAEIIPDEFVRWVFPRLFRSRLPRYTKIAKRYGYTISSAEAGTVTNEQDFIELLCLAIERN